MRCVSMFGLGIKRNGSICVNIISSVYKGKNKSPTTSARNGIVRREISVLAFDLAMVTWSLRYL